jgi:hypothetical protein
MRLTHYDPYLRLLLHMKSVAILRTCNKLKRFAQCGSHSDACFVYRFCKLPSRFLDLAMADPLFEWRRVVIVRTRVFHCPLVVSLAKMEGQVWLTLHSQSVKRAEVADKSEEKHPSHRM